MMVCRLFVLAILCSLLTPWISVQGQEKNNRAALIIGIAEYESPEVESLPGVAADMVSAKKIALAMGIPERNMTILRNQDATKVKIMKAFQEFSALAADGGRAFIYFSGHGSRDYDATAKSCYEGLLSYDRQLITNDEIAAATKKLNEQVDKTIVMFDSCYSGGVLNAGTKLQTRGASTSQLKPKFFSKTTSSEAAMCLQATNFKTRGFFDKSTRLGALQENLVFITAARPDEVSYDEGASKGGVATQAIRDCLLGGAKDLNASGGVSLEEVRACSQELVNAKLTGPVALPHHITIRGNRNLIPVVATPPPVTTAAVNQPEPVKPVSVASTSSSKPEPIKPEVVAEKPTSVAPPLASNTPSKPNPLPVITTATVNQPEPAKPFPSASISPIKPDPIKPEVVAEKPIPVAPPLVSNTSKPEPMPLVQSVQPNKPEVVRPNKPEPPAVSTPADLSLASIATLKDVEAQRNPTRKLDIKMAKKTLKINQDYLDLQIKSSHDGYLYLVLLGSDKKSFYVLYPNQLDGDNRIQAGKTINLPKASWQIKAAGPAGVDHILALVADSPRDLKALEALGADPNSPFVYTLNTLKGRGALVDYLTGKGPEGRSEKFAAQMITVTEVQ